MLDSIRDPLAARVLVIQTVVMAIVYGLVFFRLELTQEGVQNMNGVIFICLVNTTFATIFSVVNNFPKEIPIFVREHQNGIYRVFSYYTAKTLVEFPSHVLCPLMFATVFYWMTNLNNEISKFFIFAGIVILVSQTALAYGKSFKNLSMSFYFEIQ
jgi:ABC-type multidrug transport system permease subunit